MSSSRADVIAELIALGLDAAPQHVCGSVRAKAPSLGVPGQPATGIKTALSAHTASPKYRAFGCEDLVCTPRPDPLTGALGSHASRAGIKHDLARKAADATQVR